MYCLNESKDFLCEFDASTGSVQYYAKGSEADQESYHIMMIWNVIQFISQIYSYFRNTQNDF